MKIIGQGIGSLTHLKSLDLSLKAQLLGKNPENLRLLGHGLKNLQNLEYFSFDLGNNNEMGGNIVNIRHLGTVFSNLNRLKELQLNLSGSCCCSYDL